MSHNLQNIKKNIYFMYFTVACTIKLYIYFFCACDRDKLLLNGSTDFYEIFCVSSGGFDNGLD